MRTYTTPKMTSEQFAPNEYFSACWQGACTVGNGNYGGYNWFNQWSHWNGQRPYGNNCHDHTGSCSQSENIFSPLVVTELHLTLKTAVIKASSEAVTQII